MNILAVEMNNLQIQKTLKRELGKIKTSKGIYIIISRPENYQLINEEIVSYLTKKLRLGGAYISLNKPSYEISKNLEEKKVLTKDILFIEGVEEDCKLKNCIPLQESKSLTELSLTISKICKSDTIKFIFLDSASTLLIYNSLEITERFMQYLINKIKNLGILLIIISVDEEKSNKLTPILAQFCDGYIKL